jgi:hypothetical protein
MNQPTLKDFQAAFDDEARGLFLRAFLDAESAQKPESEAFRLACTGRAMLEQQKRARDLMERMFYFLCPRTEPQRTPAAANGIPAKKS